MAFEVNQAVRFLLEDCLKQADTVAHAKAKFFLEQLDEADGVEKVSDPSKLDDDTVSKVSSIQRQTQDPDSFEGGDEGSDSTLKDEDPLNLKAAEDDESEDEDEESEEEKPKEETTS